MKFDMKDVDIQDVMRRYVLSNNLTDIIAPKELYRLTLASVSLAMFLGRPLPAGAAEILPMVDAQQLEYAAQAMKLEELMARTLSRHGGKMPTTYIKSALLHLYIITDALEKEAAMEHSINSMTARANEAGGITTDTQGDKL
jgi:hypothetical protein